ncbi:MULTISPECIES: glutathione peroxidase [unclassified Salinibacterium]|uniref:glutathione peroxidase n=1 Tax=unclassified Salinibacterium TaxID=2632331 RepID=UPI0014226204|nr:MULTISPECIES: glutathione peroxidase [unclassified Salinibacterium]
MTNTYLPYDVLIETASGEQTTLEEHKGKVILVVNVASKCGFTPQYDDLQELQRTYGDRGLQVLGFPCNQFKGQEPGSNEEIQEFCRTSYGVEFPVFAKIDVNGDDRHPLYDQLVQAQDAAAEAGDVAWNFEKFLVAADGTVTHRFRSKTKPTDEVVVAAIEQLLPR